MGQRLAPLSEARTSPFKGGSCRELFSLVGTFSAPNGVFWAFGKGSPLAIWWFNARPCGALSVLQGFDRVEGVPL